MWKGLDIIAMGIKFDMMNIVVYNRQDDDQGMRVLDIKGLLAGFSNMGLRGFGISSPDFYRPTVFTTRPLLLLTHFRAR